MKTFTKYFFIAFILILAGAACKKEKTTSSPATGSGEYIEFKLDGQLHRMDEQLATSNVVIGSANHEGPFSGRYGLQIAFASSTPLEEATIIVWDNDPITKPHYSLELLNLTSLVSYIKPDNTQYIISDNSVGSINFTSIDTTANHSVEGTFEINNLDLQDMDGNFISTGHTLTDGKFKTTVAP